MNINYYNPYIRKELELYHHGIAGQKWGKRNGPPYPLAASAHSASEKKAGWRKSLSGEGGTSSKHANSKTVKKVNSTDHPLSKPKLQDELKDLAKIADKSVEEQTGSDVDRYVAFQGKIINESINWYDDEPKSERAKKWKSEKDKAVQNVENTLGKKFEDLDKAYIKDRNKVFDEYEDKEYSDKLYEELRKKLDKIDDIYRQRGHEKARNEYREAERLVRQKYDDKLIEVVLKDLGLPVTDENKFLIRKSQVLFWD